MMRAPTHARTACGSRPRAACERHECASTVSQAQALAAVITQDLAQAQQRRGLAFMAVSAGRSPLRLFEALREAPIDWPRVFLVLTDERVVAPDDPASNAALVRRHLLQGHAGTVRWHPPFEQWPPSGSTSADRATDDGLTRLTEAVNARLRSLPWPLDVVVLGLGDDGHIASLFDGADGLTQALAGEGPMAWVRPHTAPHPRLTLTLPILLAANRMRLLAQGPSKRAVVERACRGFDAHLPLSWLLHRARPVQIWLSPDSGDAP